MISRPHSSLLAMAITLAFTSTACTGLAQLTNKNKKPKHQTTAQRDAAAKDSVTSVAATGDLPRLRDICWGKDKTVSSAAWTKACHEQRRIALETFTKEATCNNAIAVWEKYKAYLTDDFRGGGRAVTENFIAAGTKLAKCGHTDYVFEHLAHWGDSRGNGVKLLTAMGGAGIDVEGKLLDYMKRNQDSLFGFKNSRYALEHVFSYLEDSNKRARCAEYFPYAKATSDDLFGPFNWYFRKVKCRGAEELAVVRLTSDRVGTREGACMTLGELGTSRHLRKVNIVAQSDPYNKVREHRQNGRIWATKVWPVREACKAAAGKIQLRN